MAREILVALALCGSAASLAASRRHARPTLRMGAEPLSQVTGMASMDQAVLGKYMGLDTGDDCQVEYVFLDKDQVARSKCRTLPSRSSPSRYILSRVCEDLGVIVTIDPKPIAGDWNGAGMHINFSTESTRKEGGLAVIEAMCEKLGAKHTEHIAAYGEGNERRLTGDCETASIDQFSYGVADRGCSIRIPRDTAADKKGYLEDRRPASNVDPYVATSLIFATCTSA
ncbi:hypothetical protein JL721_5438 [Aureococcus anophagefferens]|nr:hypothetical protein JL721_5438 [Aureococcus anophagefferens]